MKISGNYHTPRYMQQNNISFCAATNPVNTSIPDVNSVNARKEINDAFNKIFEMNSKTHFVDDMHVHKIYKMISDMWMFSKYIEQIPECKNMGPDFEATQNMLVDMFKNKAYFDLDFAQRKPALDKLAEFAAQKETRNAFNKFYEGIVSFILIFNADPVEKLNKIGKENLKLLFSSKAFEPISKSIDYDNIFSIFSDSKSQKLATKNIKILEDILKNPEYKFFRDSKISIDILLFPGDIRKLMAQFLAASKANTDNDFLALSVDKTTGNFQIRYSNKKNNPTKAKTYVYDKNMNKLSESQTFVSFNGRNKGNAQVKVLDFKNNSEYKIERRYEPAYKSWNIENIVRTQYDSGGNVLWREHITPSKVDGVYSIVKMDSTNHMFLNSFVTLKERAIVINKSLVSPDGTKTNVFYDKSADGNNEKFIYRIIDKDGKKLAEKTSETKRISKYSTLYTENGKEYLVRYSPDCIRVLDKQTNRINVIDLKNILGKDSQSIKLLLKNLSATELLKLNKYIKELKKVKNNKSSYDNLAKTLSSGLDLFTFEHELGHAKNKLKHDIYALAGMHKLDFNNLIHSLSMDRQLKKIYEEERKRFFDAYPKYITDFTSYFTEITSNRTLERNLDELIAEVNAIIHVPVFTKGLYKRTHYIQENFPRTIAYLMKHKL